MNSRIEFALTLSRLGFRIFPLQVGSKAPYREEGWKAIMTTDEARIRAWFNERPDMNYAVVCDEHHVIADLDEGFSKKGLKKNGIENFRKKEDAALGLVEDSIFDGTFRVRTPKGGVHLYFSCARAYGNTASSIIDDMDIRGPDGYVVGPGCYTFDDPDHNTVEGEYVVDNAVEIAYLPGWFEKMLDNGPMIGERATNAHTAAMPLDTPAAIEAAKRVLRERKVATEGDSGDQHTYVTAALVKDYAISEDKCLELMFSEVIFPPDIQNPDGRTWNDCCQPPWDFQGLKDKVHNAYRYGNRQIGAKMDALSAVGMEEIAPEMAKHLDTGEHFSAIEQPIGVDEGAAKIEAMLFSGNTFVNRDTKVDSLIPDWVPAFGVTAFLAKRGTGKSVAMFDMALNIAMDRPWNSVEVARDWACLYLCGEDDIGMQRQMRAWRQNYGVFPSDDRLLVATGVPNLMDAHEMELWAAAIKKRFKGRRVAIFIDTWQRATSTASQNDDKEMQKAIHHAEALARYLNGCSIIAFHPPKGRDDTITGSMVLENSTTCIIKITELNGSKKLVVDRIKGRGEGNFARFKLKEVYYGDMDDFGNEVSGVIPEFLGGTGPGPVVDKAAEDERMRKQVVGLFIHILPDRKKGLTYSDVADIAIAAIEQNPKSDLAQYFNGCADNEEMQKLLHMVFNPGTLVDNGDGATIQVIDGRFRFMK